MLNSLFDQVSLGVEMGTTLPISCISDGRWVLDADLNLIDTVKHIKYPRPAGVDLDLVVFENVTDLSETYPVPLIFLFTLAVKPLNRISLSNLVNPNIGIKVTVTNGKFTGRNGAQVYWDFPEAGVPYEMFSGSYAHVPGATNYIVNQDGVVRSISGNSEVVAGTGSNGYVDIVTDLGEEIEVSIPEMVLAAYGRYKFDNTDKPILFLDNDKSNYKLENLALELTSVDSAGRAATSNDELRVTTTIFIE